MNLSIDEVRRRIRKSLLDTVRSRETTWRDIESELYDQLEYAWEKLVDSWQRGKATDDELYQFIETVGQYQRLRGLSHIYVARAEMIIDHVGPRERAMLWRRIGETYYNLGELQKGLNLLKKARHAFEAASEYKALAGTLLVIGGTFTRLNRPVEALPFYRRSLRIARARDDTDGIVYALNCLGVAYRDLGQLDTALRRLLTAFCLVRKLNNPLREAQTRTNLGVTLIRHGHADLALRILRQALRLHDITGANLGRSTVLNSIGSAHLALGQPARAYASHHEALKLARIGPHKVGCARAYHGMAEALGRLEHSERALVLFNRAASIRSRLEDDVGVSESMFGSARMLLQLGRTTKARAKIIRAIQLAEQSHSVGVGRYMDFLATLDAAKSLENNR